MEMQSSWWVISMCIIFKDWSLLVNYKQKNWVIDQIELSEIYLHAGTKYYTHEKVGNKAGYGHHHTFYYCNASKQTQDEIEVMGKSGVEVSHVVGYGSWR